MLQGKIRENLNFAEISKKKIDENQEFDAKRVFLN